MEEKTYIGYAYGSFSDDTGVQRIYCNVYLLEPFSGEQSENRHFGGQCAKKYGAISPDIFAKITPGSQVKCYFDSKGKVAFMQPISGNGKA